MLTVNTFAALHANQHALAAWCSTGERWVMIDLAQLIAEGRGHESFIGRKPRCRECGTPGQYQLRPPVHRPD